MKGTHIAIDFGHLFFRTPEEVRQFADRIEKIVRVNTDQMIEEAALRYREDLEMPPTRLIVTVGVREEVG